MGLSTLFLLREMAYAEKLTRRKEAPACPSPAPASTERAAPPCLDSRFSVWPAEWPLAPLEKPKASPAEPPARWPVAIRLGAAVWPEVIVSGWGSLGLSADIGVRWRWLSASAEVHGDPPLGSVLVNTAGPVSFGRLSGGLLLCAHWGWFIGCGVADGGRFFFPNHLPVLPASIFYGSAGVRAGLELPVVPPRLFLRAALDMRAPIPPVSFDWKGIPVFASAGPTFGLALGMLVELPP